MCDLSDRGPAIPIRDRGYITASALEPTYFHMSMVTLPTLVIDASAAIKMNATINPYSMAVAALVDRISLEILFIVLSLADARIKILNCPAVRWGGNAFRWRLHRQDLQLGPMPVFPPRTQSLQTSIVQSGDSGPRVPDMPVVAQEG